MSSAETAILDNVAAEVSFIVDLVNIHEVYSVGTFLTYGLDGNSIVGGTLNPKARKQLAMEHEVTISKAGENGPFIVTYK